MRASVAFTCDIKLEALRAEVIHEIAEEDLESRQAFRKSVSLMTEA
jgi:hypothetical protein